MAIRESGNQLLTLLPGHGGHFSLNEAHLSSDGTAKYGECCGGGVEREGCEGKIVEADAGIGVLRTQCFFTNR